MQLMMINDKHGEIINIVLPRENINIGMCFVVCYIIYDKYQQATVLSDGLAPQKTSTSNRIRDLSGDFLKNVRKIYIPKSIWQETSGRKNMHLF
jgi:hypothetical protein